MLDLSLILIVMATLLNTPANTSTQADYQLVNSGINTAPFMCKGNLFLDTGKSEDSQRLRFHHKCNSSWDLGSDRADEVQQELAETLEVDIILDLVQKRAVMINHQDKSYRMEQADKNMLKQLIDRTQVATDQSQPFLDNTVFWLHRSPSDFWLSRIQDPAQGNLFTDLNLFSNGFNSHLSLKYSSSAMPKEAFDIPANYKRIQ